MKWSDLILMAFWTAILVLFTYTFSGMVIRSIWDISVIIVFIVMVLTIVYSIAYDTGHETGRMELTCWGYARQAKKAVEKWKA